MEGFAVEGVGRARELTRVPDGGMLPAVCAVLVHALRGHQAMPRSWVEWGPGPGRHRAAAAAGSSQVLPKPEVQLEVMARVLELVGVEVGSGFPVEAAKELGVRREGVAEDSLGAERVEVVGHHQVEEAEHPAGWGEQRNTAGTDSAVAPRLAAVPGKPRQHWVAAIQAAVDMRHIACTDHGAPESRLAEGSCEHVGVHWQGTTKEKCA